MNYFQEAYFALFCLDQRKLLQFVDSIDINNKYSFSYSSLHSVVVSTLELRSEFASSNPVFAMNTFWFPIKDIEISIYLKLKSDQSKVMGSSLTAARVTCNM